MEVWEFEPRGFPASPLRGSQLLQKEKGRQGRREEAPCETRSLGRRINGPPENLDFAGEDEFWWTWARSRLLSCSSEVAPSAWRSILRAFLKIQLGGVCKPADKVPPLQTAFVQTRILHQIIIKMALVVLQNNSTSAVELWRRD